MIEYRDEDKTDWFPGTVAPAYEGVYERRYDGCWNSVLAKDLNIYCRFSKLALLDTDALNEVWFVGHETPELAASSTQTSNFKLGRSDFEWRGLKAEPNTVVITPEVHVVAHNMPGLALDSGEFIPAEVLNKSQPEEDLF